ncbi:hypothetical protein K7I13_01560 [Brucepastera parasyntrophica]|uniref:hypothetical protein n=1 Tax=Brucepastera parasyntrophica TaxID=2880008 RepID=UPI00210BD79D|nr:hypothetical protein [Brucepastera parasyntrophica]ULQ60046.1 hypothetical protein K7I13_01560 [Brucepastera parasyntrophica]
MGLKNKARKIRYYILFLIRGFKQKKNYDKAVYIEMLRIVPNRRMLQLSRFFSENGYICFIHIPVKQFSTMDISGLKLAREKNVIRAKPKDMKKCALVLSDTVESIPESIKSEKRIYEIDYDVFNKNTDFSDGLFYPISFHPKFLTRKTETKALAASGNDDRKILALFVGWVDDKYTDEKTHTYFHINTRMEVFSHITEHISPQHLYIPESFDDFLSNMDSGNLKNKVILINSAKFSIPGNRYFDILAQTTFFIHMCGYVQPFCHNQIETLAAGVIPISQFSHFFYPHLENRVNVLAYEKLSELVSILEKICGGEYPDIKKMKKNCVQYYKQNLSFDSFIEKINQDVLHKIYICAGELSII